MNLFQVIFLDVVLLMFPILIYLIYLTTNKNIKKNLKKMYLSLALVTSFFLLYNYGINNTILIPVLVLNSIVIFSYLEDRYILANMFSIFILFSIYESITSVFNINTGIITSLFTPYSISKKNEERRARHKNKFFSLLFIFFLVDKYIKYISKGNKSNITFKNTI